MYRPRSFVTISHRKTIYLGEDKMVNNDLIGVAMEGRTDNDFTCEELLNGIDKLKIMMYLRASEDCPILNSAQEVFIEKPPGEKYLCSRRLKDNSTEVFFTDKDEVTFEKKISIAQKHIDSARYDIITRFIQLLISSIGTAVEDYIIKNIPTKDIKSVEMKECGFYNYNTIVSPELSESMPRVSTGEISYNLKDGEFITVDHKSPPVFVVMEDMLVVNKVAEATEITAQLTLRFNFEGYSLRLTEGKND